MGTERRQQVLRARIEALERGEVVLAPGTFELARQLLVPALAQPGGVALVRTPRTSSTKRRKRGARPGASSWSHSTGVTESVTGAPVSSSSSSGR